LFPSLFFSPASAAFLQRDASFMSKLRDKKCRTDLFAGNFFLSPSSTAAACQFFPVSANPPAMIPREKPSSIVQSVFSSSLALPIFSCPVSHTLRSRYPRLKKEMDH